MSKKITPFLWFDDQAEEAMRFYCKTFKNSRPGKIRKNDDGGVFSVTFTLEGQEFYALNGGPHFKFTPAISLFVDCKDQREVDRLWKALTAGGGKASRCGWLTDKFGLSWQLIPKRLGEALNHRDDEVATAAFEAMMEMGKIDVAKLEKAAAGAKKSKKTVKRR